MREALRVCGDRLDGEARLGPAAGRLVCSGWGGALGAEHIGVLARGVVGVRDDPFDLHLDRHALPVVDVEKATQRSVRLGYQEAVLARRDRLEPGTVGRGRERGAPWTRTNPGRSLKPCSRA